MKVEATANRAGLVAALRLASTVLDGRDLGGVMNCACFTLASWGGLLTATDGAQSVACKVDGAGEGELLLPVARAMNFLSASKAEAVAISGDKSGVTLSARGAGKIDLPSADPKAFPGRSTFSPGDVCEAKLEAQALDRILDAAAAASDPNAQHVRNTALAGTHLEVGPASVTAVCSDQISCAAASTEAATNGTGSGTLPRTLAKLFSHALAGKRNGEEAELSVGNNWASLKVEGVTVYGPLLQMKFPNWKRWIQAGRTGEIQLKSSKGDGPDGDAPKGGALEFACQAADLLAAVRLAATAADKADASPSVLVTLADDFCTCESRGEFGGGTVATAEFGASAVGHKQQAQARVQAARFGKILSACGGGPVKVFVGQNAVGLECDSLAATIARIHHAQEGGEQ